MNCAFHADVPNTAFCIRCGRALCAQCTHTVRGSVYCEPCLAEVVEGATAGVSNGPVPKAAAKADMGPANPGAAFAIGLIPGVGAIYNGDFMKAAVHILIFGLLITLGDVTNAGMFVFMTFAFYWYMPFEAYYTAKKRKLGQLGIELDSPIDRLHRQLGIDKDKELFGGVALIAAGAVLLLANFEIFDFRNLGRLWPLLVIGLGVWLLKKRQEKSV
jgi:hypothetical protein